MRHSFKIHLWLILYNQFASHMWLERHGLLKPQPPNEDWKWLGLSEMVWTTELAILCLDNPTFAGQSQKSFLHSVTSRFSAAPQQPQLCEQSATGIINSLLFFYQETYLCLQLWQKMHVYYLTTLWAYKWERRALFCILWYCLKCSYQEETSSHMESH